MTAHQLLTAATHLADHGGPPPDWNRHAPCAGSDTHIWFPPRGGSSPTAHHHATQICATCPLHLPCLADGITTHRDGLESGTRAAIPNRTIRDHATRPHRTQRPTDHRRRRAAALTADGHTAADIARALGVSDRTVQRWRAQARRAHPDTGKAA